MIVMDLDALAGDCCYKYMMQEEVQGNSITHQDKPFYLVTVSVDRVDFMEKVDKTKNLRLSAFMLMAKGSTLMVKIDVLQQSEDQQWQ